MQTHSWEDFQTPLATFSLEVIFHVSISSQKFIFLVKNSFSTTRRVHRDERIKNHHVLNPHGRYHSLHSSSLCCTAACSPQSSSPFTFWPFQGIQAKFRLLQGYRGSGSVQGASAGLALLTTGGCQNPETQLLHKVHSEILNDLKGLGRTEKKVILLALWGDSARAGAGDLDFTPCSESCHLGPFPCLPLCVSVGRN